MACNAESPRHLGGAGGLSRVSRGGSWGISRCCTAGCRSANWLARRSGTWGGIVERLLGQRAGVNLRAVVDDPAHGRRAARGLDAHAQLRSERYPELRAAQRTVVFAVEQFHPRPSLEIPGADGTLFDRSSAHSADRAEVGQAWVGLISWTT